MYRPKRAVFSLTVLASVFLFSFPASAQIKNITLLSNRPGPTRGGWGYTDSIGREFALVCRASAPEANGIQLDIVDITNPSVPVLAKTISIAPGASDLKQVRTHQRWAYAVNQSGGSTRAALQIINLSNPYTASTVGQYPGSLAANSTAPNGAHTVHIDGDYAYLGMNGASDDWWIVSLANPTAPVQVSHLAPPAGGGGLKQSHDSFVKGDTGYVAWLGGGFSVVNIANKSAPVRLADVLYPGAFTHNTWTTEDGKYLFTTDEVNPGGHLLVWDVRFPASITQVGSYEAAPDRTVHNVFVKGNYAYLSYYSEGIRILDIEDPTYPVEVGSYDTFSDFDAGGFDGCWDVYPYFNSGVITAYDRKYGLFVFSFNNAKAGKIVGQVTEMGSGMPIPGAQVRLSDVDKSVLSEANGHFSIRTVDGPRQVEVSRFGYVTDTVTVNAVLSDSVTLNVALTPLPTGTLSGTAAVLGLVVSSLSPSGVRVGVADDILFEDTTDASGNFSLTVPAGVSLAIFAGKWGLVTRAETLTVPPSGVVSRNYQLAPGYNDPFEFDQGWTVGDSSDDAPAGIWERVIPLADYNDVNFQTQPGADHTAIPGQMCYITGQLKPNQAFQDHDVDAGKTTLYSPVMDLSGYINPILSYWRWFSNNGGANPTQDTIRTEISNDGGSTWVSLEKYRFTQNTWAFKQFTLSGLLPVTNNMRFRAVVSDRQGDSNVEGGIDDFAVSGAPIRGDFNTDGNVNAADIVIYMNAVFLGSPVLTPAQGDFNGDCLLTSADVIILLNYAFLGIPLGPVCTEL